MTQRSEEPTRKYLDRFNDECLEIDGLTDSVASLYLTNGLLNEDFRKYLTTKPVWTMQEIQNVAREYINDEEVSQVVAANKRQPTYNQPRQHGSGERLKEHSKDAVPAKNSGPFPPDGKLAKLSHLIREPRRQDRDRPEDKDRVVRQRREPEEDSKRGLTVVNIVVGRDVAPRSTSACRKDAKVLAISSSSTAPPPGKVPLISFGPEDQWTEGMQENLPMVIMARVGTGLVKRILVDTGADSNIMFRNVFDALGLRDADLKIHQHGVVGLGDHFIKLDGIIYLPIFIGRGPVRRTVMAEFIVLRDFTAYNIIMGRETINDLRAIIYTKLLVMKFVADNGSIGSIKGDLETTVKCDNASLSLRKKSKEAVRVFLADLDARVEEKPRPEPEGDLEKIRVGDSEAKFTFVNRNLPHEVKEPLVEVIRKNGDLKPSDKWRMCVDYSNLNKACPKDSFPLPNIDTLVDVASGYRYLSFMDAYSGYNQIPMHQPDKEKTACIMPGEIYCYKVMPFGLKNAGATYQRLMNKIFYDLISKTVEVYVDDILVKTIEADDLIGDLETVFAALRRYDMRLNPLKCAFAMEAGKFLGFMITQRGVEANPEKCEAILQMTSPGSVKDVQRLAVTALSRFLGASAANALPFFNLMKKGIAFEWTPALIDEALAAVLLREDGKVQQPIYFVNRVLQGAELRYSKLEKLTYALLTSSRRLRKYFQGHPITIRTDQAIRQVLQKPDLVGRMMAWAIELSQYDLQYEPRHAIKAQAMANFLVEMEPPTKLLEEQESYWKALSGVVYEQSIKFDFPVSSNQAEYKALLGGLQLAKEVGATRVEVCSDSQIVTSQVNGTYQARDSLLQKYFEQVNRMSKEFNEVTVQHVPREKNIKADLLSKLASTKPGTGNRSFIQGLMKELAVTLHFVRSNPSWIDAITNFLESGKLPSDDKAVRGLRRESAKYTATQGQLFKKGLSQPLLKCLHFDQTDYVLREVHEGCCGHHIGGKALARKLVRVGYYWPSMMADSKAFVEKCKRCQENANFHKAPAAKLSLLMASQPFSQWEIDLLGPFPVGPGQVKYIIMAIDYYTKWVKAEPLASISSANCRKFMWRLVITRFGILMSG
nr:uncharacterized protein LOC112727076 [Arachis hypogaea]